MKRAHALALGLTSAALAATVPRRADSHSLPPGSFGSPEYTAVLEARGGTKAVFQTPSIEAAVKAGDTLNHLLSTQLKNWLNGFQFSYKIPASDLHVVVASYGSANLLTYSDEIWAKYKLGEKYKVVDPLTNAPSVRNVFYPARFAANASQNPDDPKSVYQDTGIEALQRRGVVYLT